MEPMQIIQDNLPILRSLTIITSSESLLPCKMTYSQVPRIGMRMGVGWWESMGRIRHFSAHTMPLGEDFLKR